MQLVVNTPGTFITQKDECFRLKQNEKILDISPGKVESIVLSNQAMLSTQAVILALENNIDIIFMNGFGDPLGRIWFSKMGSTALIRRKQLEAAATDTGFSMVIDMIAQKISNQFNFLKKLMHARPGKEKAFEKSILTIENAIASVEQLEGELADKRDRVMGLEGSAGKAYFQCIAEIIPEKYRFSGRSRRPAKDHFNAALNYSYGMLYSIVEKACILAGLDPYVGYLHTDNYNKKSMVFDLIEPFRIFGEQAVIYLFTGRKIKDEYFDSKDEAVSLNGKGKPVIVEAVNRHLDETVRFRRRNVKRRHIIQHEAHRLANILLADEEDIVKRKDWLEINEF